MTLKPDRKIILQSATVLRPGDEPNCIEGADIHIQGDRLVAIAGQGNPFPLHEADEIIDLKNDVVLPGFINTHTHTHLTYLRGVAQDVGLADFFQCMSPHGYLASREYAYGASLLAQAEMIRNGITTCVDMCQWSDEIAKAARDSGLRVALANEVAGMQIAPRTSRLPGYLLGASRFIPDDTFGQERLSQAEEELSNIQKLNCDRIYPFLSPHALYSCSPDLLAKIASVAKELQLPISIHLAEEERIETQIRRKHGSSIALLRDTGILDVHCLGVHCIYLKREEIEKLGGASFGVAHCLGSNLKLGDRPMPLSDFIDAGIPVGLGTDSVMSNDNLDLLEEARLVSLVHKSQRRDAGFIPDDYALQMATCLGAQAIGLGQHVGRLRPGFLADLIVLERKRPYWHSAASPLFTVLYAASSADIHSVMVSGSWVMRYREILTFNEEEVLQSAKTICSEKQGRSS